MADEAVLRIVLQDDGSGTVPPGAQPPPKPPATPPVPVSPTVLLSQPPPALPKPPPKPSKTNLDFLLDAANTLRGTLGGLGGAVFGGTLDVISAYRDAAKNAAAPAPPPTTPTTPTGASTAAATAAARGASTAAAANTARGASTAAAASAAAGGAAATAGGASAALGAAAPYVAVFAAVVVAATAAMKALIDVIHRAEKQYEDYSPEIARAQAYEEVRQVMGDLRRAQEIAPEMAKYIRARADMEQTYEDAKLRILEKLLPSTTKGVQFMEAVIPLMETVIDTVMAPITILSAINTLLEDAIPDFLKKDEPEILDPASIIFKDSKDGGVDETLL